MPKIQISEKLFYTLLGRTLTFDELEEELTVAKAEIDALADEEGNIKIELNDTNRPDLWTSCGLSRQLRAYNSKTLSQDFPFFVQDADSTKKIIVNKSVRDIRPYVLGFIIRGKKVDDDLLAELIQVQEKLSENFGQKRKAIAIGIYRENLIEWPVKYHALNPDSHSFVPLDFSDSLTLKDILNTHPKGKEYGHIIAQEALYPMLQDNKDNVLSMPPIINSAHIGAVQIGDDELFIECTGSNFTQLMLAINILACDCYELGFEVTRVKVEYPQPYKTDDIEVALAKFTETQDSQQGYNIVAPLHFQPSIQASVEEVDRMLGISVSAEEIKTSLTKMNLAVIIEDNIVTVIPPAFRNDFLHSVDIIEDIIVGYGLNNFKPQYPQHFTIGRITEIEALSRKLIQTMVGLGFQEMIYPYLGSRQDFIEKLYEPQYWEEKKNTMVQISNPISENYEFVRNSILPNLLETERVSAHSPYPHKICEIGKIAYIDEQNNLGSRTDTALGFLIAENGTGFTDINSIVAAIFYYINMDWSQELLEDNRFIDGRACKIFIEKQGKKIEVGYYGEIHPRVLESNGIGIPCVCGEITLENII